MRIDQLHLIAYGAFTDHLLDLSAPGLHVVYGPNEAGKSTALSSLDQLLYGFDERTPFGFKHGLPKLRLAARLRGPSGEVLDVTRRKARKDSLRDGTGAPIPQEALAPFLNGITRETFKAEFALSGEELRKGGEFLASGKGDLVQALAASHSGLRLPELLKAIDARREGLYKRRGTNPKINVKIAELRAARDRLAEASLKPGIYAQAELEMKRAQDELGSVKKKLEDARGRQKRLALLVQTLPVISQRRRLQDEIEAISAEGVCAPDDVVERLPGLRGARPGVVVRLEEHRGRLEEVERRLGDLDIDELLLQHGDAVDGLFQDLKAVQEAVKRRVLSAGEVDRIRKAAEALLREVHPDASLDDTSLFQIPDPVREQARRLNERRTTADGLLQRARVAVQERQEKKERADKAVSELPPVEDSSLRAAQAAVPSDLLRSIEAAQDDEGRVLKRCERLLHDLGIADLDSETAVRLSLPARQETEEANSGADECVREQQETLKERRKAKARLADLQGKLERILADDPPPTPAELGSARQRRDGLLAGLAADPGLAPAVREAVAEADRLADAMLRRSERVADRTRLEADVRHQTDQLDQLSQQLDELDEAVASHERHWEELWRHYPAGPPARGAATRVFDRFEQLRSAEEELQGARTSLANRRRQAQEHVERLRELLREPHADSMVRWGGATILSELPELMEIADTRATEHEEAVRRRTELEAHAGKEAEELQSALVQQVRCENELTEAAREWELFLRSVELPAGRDTQAGLTDLDRLAKVTALVEQADTAEARTAQDDRLVTGFHARLQATADRCRIALPEDPEEGRLAVEALHKKLTRCRSDEQIRVQLEATRDECREAVAKTDVDLREIDLRIAEFTARTGVSHDRELEAAVERTRRREEARAELRAVDTALPGDKELDGLLRESEDVTSEQVSADLRRVDEMIADLEEEYAHRTEQSVTRQNDFKRLDGSAAAAQAGADAAMIVAEFDDEAEEYLRLEVARHYVLQCQEQYRRRGQDPVLNRASSAFRKLTCDRFTGLALSDEDADRPVILAQRADGTLLTADGLSEGARDQLYLALRLAALERHADNGRALPLAVDDILMTFDNERTTAGLHVLHDLTDRFQVIVFTHHDHVAEIATAELPSDRIHLHRLSPTARS